MTLVQADRQNLLGIFIEWFMQLRSNGKRQICRAETHNWPSCASENPEFHPLTTFGDSVARGRWWGTMLDPLRQVFNGCGVQVCKTTVEVNEIPVLAPHSKAIFYIQCQPAQVTNWR